MANQVHELAEKLLRTSYDQLGEREKRVLQHLAKHLHISRNTNKEFRDHATFGQRLADRVSSFGGSWAFITLFGALLVAWIVLNTLVLSGKLVFDPYPFIFLNLVLSMLAAVQAPVIMMSQNRQAQKDRIDAAHDYEVNLKAELEIMALHEKLDALRQNQWLELIALQQQQIDLLKKLAGESNPESA